MQKQKRTGRLIGFTGFKGSGKSTAASVLEQHGFVRWSFADPIRDMLIPFLQSFGLTMDEAIKALVTPELKEVPIERVGLTARQLMQTLGSEWGRSCVNANVWTEVMRHKLNKNPDQNTVIDDVRFDNEADLIRDLGGQIIFVQRETNMGGGDWHRSECGVIMRKSDKVIANNSTKADLSAAVLDAVAYRGAVAQ